jgi:RNA polymerase-binding transcription factor DksA
MNIPDTTLSKIKESLSSEKVQIEKALKNLKRDDPFSDPGRINDNADPGTDAFEDSEHLRIEVQEEAVQAQLAAINAALDRIAGGTYGTCSSCGKPIDPDRLLAMPTATVCISCEKKSES